MPTMNDAVMIEFRAKTDKVYEDLKKIQTAGNSTVTGQQANSQAQLVAVNAVTSAYSAQYAAAKNVTNEMAKQETHAKGLLEKLALAAKTTRKEQRSTGELALARMMGSPTGAVDFGADVFGAGLKVLIVEEIGRAFAKVTEKAVELRDRMREGKITASDFAGELFRVVPVLGSFIQGFDAIRELITGERAEMAAVAREMNVTRVATDAVREGILRTNQAFLDMAEYARKARQEIGLIGTEGDVREQKQLVNKEADNKVAAWQEWHSKTLEIDKRAAAERAKITEDEENKKLVLARPNGQELADAESVVKNRGRRIKGIKGATPDRWDDDAATIAAAKEVVKREEAYQTYQKSISNIDTGATGEKKVVNETYADRLGIDKTKIDAEWAEITQRQTRERGERTKDANARIHAGELMEEMNYLTVRAAERVKKERALDKEVVEARERDKGTFGREAVEKGVDGEEKKATRIKQLEMEAFDWQTEIALKSKALQIQAADAKKKIAEDELRHTTENFARTKGIGNESLRAAEENYDRQKMLLAKLREDNRVTLISREAERVSKAPGLTPDELKAFDTTTKEIKYAQQQSEMEAAHQLDKQKRDLTLGRAQYEMKLNSDVAQGQIAMLRGQHKNYQAELKQMGVSLATELAGAPNDRRAQDAILQKYQGEVGGFMQSLKTGGHAEAVDSRAGRMAGVGPVTDDMKAVQMRGNALLERIALNLEKRGPQEPLFGMPLQP